MEPTNTKQLITVKDVMRLLKTSRSTAEKIGKASGALVHIGRAARYDAVVLSDYLERQRIAEQEERQTPET